MSEKEFKKKFFTINWIFIVISIVLGVSIIFALIIFALQIHFLTVEVHKMLRPDINMQARNCLEAAGRTRQSGVYEILVSTYDSKPFEVSCNEALFGGGWTVILRRVDGSIDFYRNWLDYKNGFGNLYNEFWIGLDKLHALTNGTNQELLIELITETNVTYAQYQHFAVGSEADNYTLKELGTYSGNAGDALSYHLGQKFSTKDHDSDAAAENCAVTFHGAWWFRYCRKSHLNGKYGASEKGMEWLTNSGTLKAAQMMIRPLRKLL